MTAADEGAGSAEEDAAGAEAPDDAVEDSTGDRSDEAGVAPAGGQTGPPEGRRRVLDALTLLVAAALMVSGLVAWTRAATADDLEPSATRDAALVAAKRGIATMNTLDYRTLEEGLASWKAVTTGVLHDQLGQVTDEERQLLADQRKISTGRVVDAAVLDLGTDPGHETATVIAAVEVEVRDGGSSTAEPTVKRNRFSADLVRVGGVWKLESLQQVPVSLS